MKRDVLFWVYFCESCSGYHHGWGGICPICSSTSDAYCLANQGTAQWVLSEFQTEDQFVQKRSIGLNGRANAKNELRLMYRRCQKMGGVN